MAVFAADSLFTGMSLRATALPEVIRWLSLGLIAKSFSPAPWLGFSLTYSRGNYREALGKSLEGVAINRDVPDDRRHGPVRSGRNAAA